MYIAAGVVGPPGPGQPQHHGGPGLHSPREGELSSQRAPGRDLDHNLQTNFQTHLQDLRDQQTHLEAELRDTNSTGGELSLRPSGDSVLRQHAAQI